MGNSSSEAEYPPQSWTANESQEEAVLRNGSVNVTWSCVSHPDADKWNSSAVIASFIILGLINVMVIVGNTLVIMAVFLSEKLRSVTNLFIVSLAVSDLMVGLAVLPFSTANEVLGVWIFGTIWCEIWLAVDVWMCTASILNLCAISLDRYVAVTRPVSYPSIMSSKRAKILIALVWCVSFVICFPPLVGWNDSRQQQQLQHGRPVVSSTFFNNAGTTGGRRVERYSETNGVLAQQSRLSYDTLLDGDVRSDDSLDLDYYDDSVAARNTSTNEMFRYMDEIAFYFTTNVSNFMDNATTSNSGVINDHFVNYVPLSGDLVNMSMPCQCQLISDKGYRIYSAVGSFYLPMFVMMFFYWRIYRAAVETTRAINQGFRTTKSGGGFGGRFEEQRLTLRIHRGRSSTDLFAKTNGNCESATTNVSFRSGNRHVRNSSLREIPATAHVGSGGMTFPPVKDRKVRGLHSRHRSAVSSGSGASSAKVVNGSKKKTSHRRWTSGSKKTCLSGNSAPPSSVPYMTSHLTHHHHHIHHPGNHQSQPTTDTVSSALTTTSGSTVTVKTTAIPLGAEDVGMDDMICDADKRGPQLFSKMGKRNIKAQVKRFRMETKAAKTLGIIVGGFILCWLPFFTIYLIGAFCVDDCIPESLFAVTFWLGYCNSAINPCVYALFSRDFRNAFKRILCRCFMRRDHSVKERLVTMFPATFQLASFFEESEDGSNSH